MDGDNTSVQTSAQQIVIAINNLSSALTTGLLTLDADNLTSGTVPAGRMPGLTGDVTSAAGSVATTIANLAVTTAKINDLAVTAGKLASDAVTTAKILDANVTQAKLASNVAGTGPTFFAERTTNQSINNTTFTKIQVNSEIWDSGGFYDNATNYRFLPTVSGYYIVGASVSYGSVTGGNNIIAIYKDGAIYGGRIGGANYNSSVSSLVYLDGVTNYVEAYTYQASGGAINAVNASFWGVLVRAT